MNVGRSSPWAQKILILDEISTSVCPKKRLPHVESLSIPVRRISPVLGKPTDWSNRTPVHGFKQDTHINILSLQLKKTPRLFPSSLMETSSTWRSLWLLHHHTLSSIQPSEPSKQRTNNSLSSRKPNLDRSGENLVATVRPVDFLYNPKSVSTEFSLQAYGEVKRQKGGGKRVPHQSKPHIIVRVVNSVILRFRILAQVPNVQGTVGDIADMSWGRAIERVAQLNVRLAFKGSLDV